MIRAAIKKGADVNTKEDGDCPLHWAAFWGDRAVTQVLLAAGADRQATNKYGRIAAVDAQRMGHTDVVRLLFEWGADAVAETRQAGAEIAELENSKDTIGLAEYIESHRRDFILRFQCDEAEMVLSKMVKEENSAKEELAAAVHAKDIDAIQVACERANSFKGLGGKAEKAMETRAELIALETEMIEKLHQVMEDALRLGPAKLEAAIEVARRKGKRLEAEVESATQRLADLQTEWAGMEAELKEALSVAKQGIEEKDEAEEKVQALEELMDKYKRIKPIRETIETIKASLAELQDGGAAAPAKGKKK